MKFCNINRYKKVGQQFFPLPLLLLLLNQGSQIRDTRSGIRDPGWIKIRIRDKHNGSATLVTKVIVGLDRL
jgi:hypothetical protein